MEYKIAAHPTRYAGVNFRSRLEARWAAFFDLLTEKDGINDKWVWEYEPLDYENWTPDFRVQVHKLMHEGPLLGEVKPYDSIERFKDHPVWEHEHGLMLGNSPKVAQWRWYYDIGKYERMWFLDPFNEGSLDHMWREAGNRTQWRPR